MARSSSNETLIRTSITGSDSEELSSLSAGDEKTFESSPVVSCVLDRPRTFRRQ